MRKTSDRTSSTPYIAHWDAVELDITSTDADQAPVRLAGLDGVTYVNLIFSGATTALTFGWQLCLVDKKTGAVIRVIEFDSTASARRQALAGAAGHYMHDDVIVDIGGVGSSKDDFYWVLVLASIGGDSLARLVAYGPARLQAGA